MSDDDRNIPLLVQRNTLEVVRAAPGKRALIGRDQVGDVVVIARSNDDVWSAGINNLLDGRHPNQVDGELANLLDFVLIDPYLPVQLPDLLDNTVVIVANSDGSFQCFSPDARTNVLRVDYGLDGGTVIEDGSSELSAMTPDDEALLIEWFQNKRRP